MQNTIIMVMSASLTMSLLALLYLATTPFLSRYYSEKGRYYAWLIVVLGLIIPFRPQFDTPLVSVEIPGAVVQSPTVVQPPSELRLATITITQQPETTGTASIPWLQLITVIWLAGIIASITYHAIGYYRFITMTKRWGDKVTDKGLLDLLCWVKSEMGISKPIELYLYPGVNSPMMVGFIRPRILIPRVDFTQEEFCFILLHELTHYKRRDLYYKCAVLFATVIHWFNPVVYLMANAINAQCELACDEEVVRGSGSNTRQRYSETILYAMRHQRILKTAFSTNFYGGKKGMKNRIHSIMDMGKKKVGFFVIGTVLLLTLSTGLIFASSTNTTSPESETDHMYPEYNEAYDYSEYTAYTEVQDDNDYPTYTEAYDYYGYPEYNESTECNMYELQQIQFMWPLDGHTNVASGFGYRYSPISARREFHPGLDIPAPSRTEILAAYDGVVTFAGWLGANGLTVIIDHGNGISTLYAHNSRNRVREGAIVTRGQHIADVGTTGVSTANHLHFEIRVDDIPVDPMLFLE